MTLQIAKKHGITPTMLRNWIGKKSDYQDKWIHGQRRGTTGRKAALPELEVVLKERFLAKRKGDKVKRGWFKAEGCRLLNEMYKDNPVV